MYIIQVRFLHENKIKHILKNYLYKKKNVTNINDIAFLVLDTYFYFYFIVIHVALNTSQSVANFIS